MHRFFVPAWPGCRLEPSLDLALAIARRVPAQIDVTYVRPDLETYCETMAYGALMAPISFEEIDLGNCCAEEEAEARFYLWRRRHALTDHETPCTQRISASWAGRQGGLPREIARKGCLADLILVPMPQPALTFNPALDAALFETARPVLAVPALDDGAAAPISETPLDHVAIAWNGSRSATRAVIGVMPLLQKADRVSILMVNAPDRTFIGDADADDLDLAKALMRHGISAAISRIEANGAPVGDTLLHAAAGQGATMLVMGAYTHPRIFERLTGGVTRHILQHARMPVLLAH